MQQYVFRFPFCFCVFVSKKKLLFLFVFAFFTQSDVLNAAKFWNVHTMHRRVQSVFDCDCVQGPWLSQWNSSAVFNFVPTLSLRTTFMYCAFFRSPHYFFHFSGFVLICELLSSVLHLHARVGAPLHSLHSFLFLLIPSKNNKKYIFLSFFRFRFDLWAAELSVTPSCTSWCTTRYIPSYSFLFLPKTIKNIFSFYFSKNCQ